MQQRNNTYKNRAESFNRCSKLLLYCQYLERPKYKNCNESQNNEVNGVGSIPVWSGGINFEEIGQKQNGSF